MPASSMRGYRRSDCAVKNTAHTRFGEPRPRLSTRRRGNLRAVQILLGHSKIENTVRCLGVDVEDALTPSLRELRSDRGGLSGVPRGIIWWKADLTDWRSRCNGGLNDKLRKAADHRPSRAEQQRQCRAAYLSDSALGKSSRRPTMRVFRFRVHFENAASLGAEIKRVRSPEAQERVRTERAGGACAAG